MASPSADQVQMAQEVLAGTREITGTSAPREEPPTELSEDAKRQAMEVTTPEVQAQVTQVELTGYAGPSIQEAEVTVGVERLGSERMPDWRETASLDAMREEKAREISTPGE